MMKSFHKFLEENKGKLVVGCWFNANISNNKIFDFARFIQFSHDNSSLSDVIFISKAVSSSPEDIEYHSGKQFSLVLAYNQKVLYQTNSFDEAFITNFQKYRPSNIFSGEKHILDFSQNEKKFNFIENIKISKMQTTNELTSNPSLKIEQNENPKNAPPPHIAKTESKSLNNPNLRTKSSSFSNKLSAPANNNNEFQKNDTPEKPKVLSSTMIEVRSDLKDMGIFTEEEIISAIFYEIPSEPDDRIIRFNNRCDYLFSVKDNKLSLLPPPSTYVIDGKIFHEGLKSQESPIEKKNNDDNPNENANSHQPEPISVISETKPEPISVISETKPEPVSKVQEIKPEPVSKVQEIKPGQKLVQFKIKLETTVGTFIEAFNPNDTLKDVVDRIKKKCADIPPDADVHFEDIFVKRTYTRDEYDKTLKELQLRGARLLVKIITN